MYNERRSSGNLTRSLWVWVLLIGLLAVSLTACSRSKTSAISPSVDLTKVFPSLPGWTVSQAVQAYDHEHLFNLVDGQADSFFVYGFEQVAVQRYQNDAGLNLNIEIWRLATPADAFGLFTEGRAGTPATIGNEGDADPGLRLAFWQDRYFVSVSVDQNVPDETLMAFGKDISKSLPSGGTQPAVMALLPKDNLVERSSIFFHEEMSVQMEVWLGSENILGLSQDTDGVVARYKLGDATVRLMLVEYPTAGQAAAGLKALQGGGVTDLVASNQKGKLLGAVFGKVEAAQAESVLQKALK